MAKVLILGLTIVQATALAQLEKTGALTGLINTILGEAEQINTVSDVVLESHDGVNPTHRIEYNGTTKQERAAQLEEVEKATVGGEDAPPEVVMPPMEEVM